jgi:hypothetical protein
VPNFPVGKDADGQYTHLHVSQFKRDRPPPDISGFMTCMERHRDGVPVLHTCFLYMTCSLLYSKLNLSMFVRG